MLVHGAVHGPTALAVVLSLSATGALMVLFKVSHAPAAPLNVAMVELNSDSHL